MREFRAERGVGHRGGVRRVEFVECRDQRLRNEPPTERAEMSVGIGQFRALTGAPVDAWRACHYRPCRSAGCAPAVTRSATACRGSLSVTKPSPTRTASAPADA